MIRVQRDTNPPQIAVFTKATIADGRGRKITRAASELKKAIAFFSDKKKFANDKKLTKDKFDFSVYRDAELSRELDRMFGTKCAYCESPMGHITPKDVEHFRPKSEIGDRKAGAIIPGYFWLAGDWTNLLASCPDCNRPRNHQVPGQDGRIMLGKATQFPLRDETLRVRSPEVHVAAEERARLLLDPCSDDPEEHLTFDDEGLVYPRTRAGQPSEIGQTSIQVYALQRKGLVEARRKVIKELDFKFGLLQDLVAELAELKHAAAPSERVLAKEDQVQRVKANLAEQFLPSAAYLGMVRDFVRRKKAEGRFSDLLSVGFDPESLVQNG